MVEIIPISFSGMGTRDAVLIYFFSLLAIGAASAVAYSFLILIFIYIAAAVGLVMWHFDPVRKSKDAKKMMK